MSRTKIWKDALYAGTWVTTRGQVFDCERAELQYFHDRAKAMLAKGACIPWCFEHPHDNDTIPLSASDLLARWARNTGGHIHDVRLLSPDGPLDVLMDVDDADRPKLEAIKHVSPDIRQNWRDRNGPAIDGIGPHWPGGSIACIAVTPIPVQYPQRSFDFADPVSLSAAGVDVSLSAADFIKPKEKSMPAPPKKPDDKPPEAGTVPDTDPTPGADPEGGGPIGDPAPKPAGGDGIGADAHLIAELGVIIKPLGIAVHVSPDMTLRSFVQHLCTAGKTHLATKGCEADENLNTPDEDPNQPDPNQPPEVAESPPIMMSAAPLTEREKAFAKAVIKSSTAGLRARIGVLHSRGYIDDAIKKELESGLGAVKLSASDIDADGNLGPNLVSVQIEAYERLMKTGKPGSFARPAAPAKAPARPNPLKPISTSFALSAAEDEIVGEPHDLGENPNAPPSTEPNPAAMALISPGWKKPA